MAKPVRVFIAMNKPPSENIKEFNLALEGIKQRLNNQIVKETTSTINLSTSPNTTTSTKKKEKTPSFDISVVTVNPDNIKEFRKQIRKQK